MNQFYLNNAVGAPASLEAGSNALRSAVLAFSALSQKKELDVSPLVVLDKDPKQTKFGDIFLGELIHAIPDDKDRQSAYLLLRSAYPMEEYFEVDAENDFNILAGDYKLDGRDAFKLALVHKHQGMLLTFAFDNSLRKNTLQLMAAEPDATDYPATLSIDNLYAGGDNLAYIEQVLTERNGVVPDLYEEIAGYGYVHNAVERVFRKLSQASQFSVVEAFRNAIDQDLLKPHAGAENNAINPNDELVRYEQHTRHEMLFELAIYHPLALRVFIAQDKGEIFILDIKSKKELGDGGSTQNRALRAAEERFKNMKKAL